MKARLGPRSRLSMPTAALCAAVLVSTGCSSARPDVALAPDASAPACARPVWPATIADRARVATDPEAASIAAWGDPAIIARCGVPALGPTTEDCVSVDGVDWVLRTLRDGSAATTYGRSPAIEVLVPEAYGPAPLLLPAFGDAARALPATDRHCS